ncbi:YegS/Rv2252/BmrU family lipid kinase [Mycoplasmatota bacterium]|nr:YegS/Rv2252/BmrU family lipid kinase [Mycoplasmatota bacterium]
MKKIKMIINPSSGRQSFQKKIDNMCLNLLDKGYLVSRYYTEKKNDAKNETIKCCKENWDIIIACGGDGTMNEVANGIALGGRKIPVAIVSSGTVNDFASILGLPSNPNEFCNMIEEGFYKDVDLGVAGSNYFVNVAAGGFLTNVAHQVSSETKTVFGRMAYYLEGLKELPKGFKPVKVRFVSEEYSSEEEILLFIVSNSSSIGGFKKLAPLAEIEDGLLDCLIIKKSDIQSIVSIFFNLLSGKHINHPNVSYFKTKDIYIESVSDVSIDIDGEYGGVLPAQFKIVPKAFRVLVKR